ncbi:hypothetical protein [Oscillibacter ruminantium]
MKPFVSCVQFCAITVKLCIREPVVATGISTRFESLTKPGKQPGFLRLNLGAIFSFLHMTALNMILSASVAQREFVDALSKKQRSLDSSRLLFWWRWGELNLQKLSIYRLRP